MTQTINGSLFWKYTLKTSLLGQLLSQTGLGSVSTQNSTATYTYDTRGRLHSQLTKLQTDSTHTYANSGTFAYDAANNLQPTSGWTYNQNNQLTAAPAAQGLAGATGLSYDASGSLTTLNGMTLSYDCWGHMTSVANTASGTVKFAYASSGRRISKTVGTVTTFYVWDGSTLVAQTDSAGTMSRDYTFGETGILSDHNSAGGPSADHMYSLDPQGNTTDLIDGTTGAAPAPVCYSPDGWTGGVSTGLWTVTRSTYPAFWGAGGHLTDSELHSVQAADLVQVSASDGGRPYIPAMGSFGTPGMPGGFGGGGSPYGFDGGNPVGDEEPDDFPVDANGRAIPYKPFLHAVNMGAGAAKFLGMMAADCNPIEALRQFVTSTDSMGKKLSPFQRMMAGFTAATVGAGGLAKAGSEVPSLMRNSNKIREAIEAAMAACKVGCFVGGTPVQMSDGSTKSIEQVKQGDKVQTRNPLTGVTEISVVAKTSVHQAYETITLELADSKTGKVVERLEGTPVHPFFTPGGLVAMGELKPEMTVISRRGPPLVVKTVTRHAHPEGVSVYNFEVEGDHTYFIGKTDGGIWVHNSCWTSPAGLIYGPDPKFGNRVMHVFAHLVADLTKREHSIFNVSSSHEALDLVDAAWLARGTESSPGVFIVEMGRIVGTRGQHTIKIVVRPGTSEILTAFPF